MIAHLRYIFFDLDDTLLDHKRAEKQSLLACQRELEMLHQVDPDLLVQTYRSINGSLWDQYSKGELDRASLSRLRFERTLTSLDLREADFEAFRQVYMSKYRLHWDWVPGAKMSWEKIRAEWPVGIITNGFSETQKEKFQRFGFDLTADSLVISEDIGVMKPHPHIFAHAANCAKISPEQILYVGDSPQTDMVGAAASGFRTAWFNQHAQAGHEAIPADFVFDAFEQLDAWLGLP
jgi:putative hydrolase of the HAD superfamily